MATAINSQPFVPDLRQESGEAWHQLTSDQKMCFVSGAMLGARYIMAKYDNYEKPKVKASSYYSLFDVTNQTLVYALDSIYDEGTYFKVPIIVVLFEYKRYLQEIGNGTIH